MDHSDAYKHQKSQTITTYLVLPFIADLWMFLDNRFGSNERVDTNKGLFYSISWFSDGNNVCICICVFAALNNNRIIIITIMIWWWQNIKDAIRERWMSWISIVVLKTNKTNECFGVAALEDEKQKEYSTLYCQCTLYDIRDRNFIYFSVFYKLLIFVGISDFNTGI